MSPDLQLGQAKRCPSLAPSPDGPPSNSRRDFTQLRTSPGWVCNVRTDAIVATTRPASGSPRTGGWPMRNRGTTPRAATAIVIAAALLTACTGPAPEPSPTEAMNGPTASATPTLTPSVDSAVAATEAAVLEAYRGYWAVKVRVYADPTQPVPPELEVYAIDTALTDVGTAQLTFQSNGIKVVGEPSLDPRVSGIVTGAETTATITDCVDGSSWTPVYVATGKSAAAPGMESRLTTTSTATYFVDRWTIQTSTVDREAPC